MKATRRGFFAGLVAALTVGKAKAAPDLSPFGIPQHRARVTPEMHREWLEAVRDSAYRTNPFDLDAEFERTARRVVEDHTRNGRIRFIRAGSTSQP